MLRKLTGIASPAGKHGKLTILIFHRVLPFTDPLFPDQMDVRRFDSICRWIKSWFNVLPLNEAVSRLKEGSLPARALSITFDDGYADNHDFALPVLKSYEISAAFFIATGYLDGGVMWNDTVIEAIRWSKVSNLDLRDLDPFGGGLGFLPIASIEEKRSSIQGVISRIKYLPGGEREEVAATIAERCGTVLPSNMMMSSEQLITMRRSGMTIGAHTVSHPILAKLDLTEVHREILESKSALESLLQEDIRLFAYPNGTPNIDYLARDARLLADMGFDAAFTTAWGVADFKSDLMQLPRFTPWDQTSLFFGLRIFWSRLSNGKLRAGQIADESLSNG